MLEIASVSWRNFLSYGDYESKIEFSNLGQCLITGEVRDSDKDIYDSSDAARIKKSNGAGKSTIPSVIQWVLFGRTMHSQNPGDAVINWFTGKNCVAKIEFKNGDSITRTRNVDGQNELIVVHDGCEKSASLNTVSTAKNQQAKLAKEFGLDWDIFCGSTFFNQYGRPWLEMSDQSCRKALERLLHVDRFSYYAQVAKDKYVKIDNDVTRLADQIATATDNINKITSNLENLKTHSNNYDNSKLERKNKLLTAIATLTNELANVALPDIDKLKKKWDIIKQIEDLILADKQKSADVRQKINDTRRSLTSLDSAVAELNTKIDMWGKMNGKMCAMCEQNVSHSHINNKIEPFVLERDGLVARRDVIVSNEKSLNDEYADILVRINERTVLVNSKKPSISVRDALSIHSDYNKKLEHINFLRKSVVDITNEINPNIDVIAKYEADLVRLNSELVKLQNTLDNNSVLHKHYHYIYKSYNDRDKIKRFIFSDHIPFINSRLKHYLNVFGLDINIELTSSLGITSDKWGYDFESGGERKRTDVAFMMAIFDFHERMYGRTCNILVLDEVDGRLDDDGLDSLVNIIKHDLADRVETVLVISHKGMMNDIFPSQIAVVREDRFSYIDSVSK